jgi:hypothetical protein
MEPINPCIINYTSEVIEHIKSESARNSKPKPFRLTMLSIIDSCQFCPNPKGEVYTYYVSPEDLHGFICCANCCQVAEEAVKDWLDTKAYGRANHFQNKKLKIRRTSGIVEDGWYLNEKSTLVHFIDNDEAVYCINGDIYKLVKIDVLNELN